MNKRELVLSKHVRRDYSAEAMEELFMHLDRLHDYAAAGKIDDVCALNQVELQGWLEEIIYTARETLYEMGVGCPVDL